MLKVRQYENKYLEYVNTEKIEKLELVHEDRDFIFILRSESFLLFPKGFILGVDLTDGLQYGL